MGEREAFEAFNRNRPYAQPRDTYQTALAPADEAAFREWVAGQKVPFDPEDPNSDYDMRAYWSEVARGGADQRDERRHYPDDYKTPWHESFSRESRYALPNAPEWDGDVLRDEAGNVVFDEPAIMAKRRARAMAEGR